jgi:hypothetical protein
MIDIVLVQSNQGLPPPYGNLLPSKRSVLTGQKGLSEYHKYTLDPNASNSPSSV